MNALAILDSLLWLLYTCSSIFLLPYCLNCYVMLFLHRRARSQMLHQDDATWQAWNVDPAALPAVTVQLPLYNERYVVQRLIEAVVRLQYPQDRLEIQVLDDSTDETTAIAASLVAHYRRAGIDITLHHRHNRTGYKAGALQEGCAHAKGEFIAIFDADFVPETDFLIRTLPFFHDPTIAMVQGRWGHLNREYSALTLGFSCGLDAHFWVEQTARCWSGLFMNFNGSGGIWRRQAIDEAGGWEGDTLTEDLDLSFRAQLRGWRMKFLPQLVCPAELPVQMSALKSQQHRWAKGSIQTAKKLAPHLWRAPLPWFTKYQAFLHLAGYLMHPFILLAALTSPLPFWFEEDVFSRGPLIGSGLFSLVTLGPLSMCLYTQGHLYPNWKQRLYGLPILLILGTGLALNNTRAILEALLGWHSPFVRTPKFHIETAADTWRSKRYRPAFPWVSLGEAVLACYCAYSLLLAWQHGALLVNPYLLIYTAGFASVTLYSLWEAMQGLSVPVLANGRFSRQAHGRDNALPGRLLSCQGSTGKGKARKSGQVKSHPRSL
jgi:cellulose synthase/poly-beta-1,6-N-acetylglucosamine synthase-like glycosyltransferase